MRERLHCALTACASTGTSLDWNLEPSRIHHHREALWRLGKCLCFGNIPTSIRAGPLGYRHRQAPHRCVLEQGTKRGPDISRKLMSMSWSILLVRGMQTKNTGNYESHSSELQAKAAPTTTLQHWIHRQGNETGLPGWKMRDMIQLLRTGLQRTSCRRNWWNASKPPGRKQVTIPLSHIAWAHHVQSRECTSAYDDTPTCLPTCLCGNTAPTFIKFSRGVDLMETKSQRKRRRVSSNKHKNNRMATREETR